MIASRSGRRTVTRFAVGFAIVVTGLWLAMVVLDSNVDLPAANAVAGALAYTNLIVNIGGTFVTFLLQLFVGAVVWVLGISAPVEAHEVGVLSWVWVLVTVFAGAFVQGIVYGAVGLAGLQWCRRRRAVMA